jgi:hypothetical protein
MKKLSLLLAVAALAWSCNNDDNNGPAVNYEVLTFESAPIVAGPTAAGENLSSYYSPTEEPEPQFAKYTVYTDAKTGLTMGLNIDEGESWSTGQPEFYAGGIAPSTHNDMEDHGAENYLNQCSVYYKASNNNGGYNGSKTFGIVYAPKTMGGEPMPAVMTFAEGVERPIDGLWVTNSTWTALYQAGLGADAEAFTVKVQGFDKEGEIIPAAVETFDLSGVNAWKWVSLAKFGKVNRIEFDVTCADTMAPAYFCIDDVKVIVE